MSTKKGRSVTVDGAFEYPIGGALFYTSSAYVDSAKKRISYNLILYATIGEERVPISFGDSRKITVHVPLAALPTDEMEKASYLKLRFTDAANQAHEKFDIFFTKYSRPSSLLIYSTV